MRNGWDYKTEAAVLGVAPTKFSQSITPALYKKIALLMLADPLRTLVELQEAMQEARDRNGTSTAVPSATAREFCTR
jgi:hypothetical protein